MIIVDGQPGPVEFNVVPLNSSTIFISWTEPQDMNTLSELLVRYNLLMTSSLSSGTEKTVLNILLVYDQRNYTVHNLNDGTYSISVTAYNSNGRGSEGEVSIITLMTPGINLIRAMAVYQIMIFYLVTTSVGQATSNTIVPTTIGVVTTSTGTEPSVVTIPPGTPQCDVMS